MTELAQGTLEDWAANPALVDDRVDFARFDVGVDRTLALRRRGIELKRLANPLVVIANYVFDSVPADAFAVGDGTLEECLVSVSRRRGRNDGAELRAAPGRAGPLR